MEITLLIILVSILLSAFFSGMEIAYISSNKIHIEIEKKQNDFMAGLLKRITKRPSKFIATMLVGNNIALVVYGFYMGDLLVELVPIEGPGKLLLHTLISTIVILITAEFLPKVFFQVYANTFVKLFALPSYIFYLLFSVISEFVIWISDLVLKYVFRTEGDAVQMSFSKTELGNYISEQMEIVNEDDDIDTEIQIFQNALEFSEVKSREVMVPRTEIEAVDISTSTEDLTETFVNTGYSKLLIYKENIDNIVGYVHSFDLFKKPQNIKKVLMPVVFVPETMLVKDVLNILTKKRKSIAVVLDEYGGTSGMMTVEDIVEELFGEIQDEHDSDDLHEEILAEDHYKFSARLEVDYINETHKIGLPEHDDYETLGGMIVYYTEGIPQQGDSLRIEQFQVDILEVSNTKIELVEIKLLEED
ncbi:hemolysin family protein [Gilvibacter sp.]|uniref:hemolysin family protein n=1 Tax=Gilvibacter sp. TaxID=2729997 RepID=UPI0025C00063|nr:hemolysin family protein [Gilvibacter sp.]NQX77191.1 HlyC/CorC family transporter [Gilvibacter sp.]